MGTKVTYEKNDKSDVGFEHPAKGREHCKNCQYFEVFGPDKCAIVSGKIEPGDWCEEYRRGKKLELGS